MAEELSNPFASIIGALTQKSGAKGVVKDTDGKVSPTLTPNEVARYEKIFGIMKKVVDPGPEAGKVDRGAAKIGNTAAMQKIKSGGGDGINIPGLGAIAGIAAAAGILGAALTTMSEDFVARVKELGKEFIKFGDDSGDEFGKLGVMAAKLAKFLPIKLLKGLPFIGALFNFGFAIDHFRKEEWFDGGWELVSGLINFLPGGQFVSPLMDGYKIYAEVLANRQEQKTGKKPAFKDILFQHAEDLAKKIGTLIQEGKVPILSTFYKFGEGIGYFLTGDWAEGFESWTHILPSLLGGKETSLYKSVAGGLEALWGLTKETSSSAYDTASSMASDAWGFMSDFFSDVGELFAGMFQGMFDWISNIASSGKKALYNSLPGWMQDAWSGVSGYDPTEGELPAYATTEYLNMTAAQQNAYNKANNIKDGMISKDGQVTRFDDQDDILAAKSGGPIDKMLGGQSKVMQTIASINAQQLSVLREIRDGINALQSSGNSFAGTSLTQEFYT